MVECCSNINKQSLGRLFHSISYLMYTLYYLYRICCTSPESNLSLAAVLLVVLFGIVNILKCLIKLGTFSSSVGSTTSEHILKCALKCSFSLFGSQNCFSGMVLNFVVPSFIFLYGCFTCLQFAFSFISSVSCLNFSCLRCLSCCFTAFVIFLCSTLCFEKFPRWFNPLAPNAPFLYPLKT